MVVQNVIVMNIMKAFLIKDLKICLEIIIFLQVYYLLLLGLQLHWDLFFGIVLGGETEEFDFIITLQYWAISDICAIIFFSLSEIIRILHDIRYKIWLK